MENPIKVPENRRRMRKPLRSKTCDIFYKILAACNPQVAASSTYVQTYFSKDYVAKLSGTKNDAPLDCTDVIPNVSLSQDATCMDETQMVLDTQEGDLNNKQAKSAEVDHNILDERNDLSQKVDTRPVISFDVENQDNLMDSMISSPLLPTDKDAEEGEISGDFMDVMPEDLLGIESAPEVENNQIHLSTDAVEDVGKDMTGVVNKTTRNLVDYSEIAVHENSRESAKQANSVTGFDLSLLRSERVLPLQSNFKNSSTKNQDLVYPVKRQGYCTEEERASKKAKFVDPTTCPENLTSVGEHQKDASQEIIDASLDEDAANDKKKKRVWTKERKAKKKMKERIKRAEKNRELGITRPKLQPIEREKKIKICRHFMKGRCHEGETCKFSHDTIPLTKSKPCCHFARHACMKGDDCPFDHELSKYPCNNYLSNGYCSRGSDCMFSHEAQPIEPPSNAPNDLNPEEKSPNSGSKKVDAKSFSTPKSVTSNTEWNTVEVTPKLSTRPPKGITFRSQGRSPLESRPSPKVDSEVKAITKTPPVNQDSKEITKMPPVTPRGINFLSFGKKPGLDNSNGRFSIKISNGIGKFRLGNLEGECSKSDATVHVVNSVKVDLPTNSANHSQKPIPMTSFMLNTSQKALQSTLAFASKFEFSVKANKPENLVQKI